MSICDKCNHKAICGFQDDVTLSCNHFQKEVVRCKDCKHCTFCYPIKEIDKEAIPAWYCNSHKGYRKPNDFCSFGERKGDGDE